jgi:hypothetical protein
LVSSSGWTRTRLREGSGEAALAAICCSLLHPKGKKKETSIQLWDITYALPNRTLYVKLKAMNVQSG